MHHEYNGALQKSTLIEHLEYQKDTLMPIQCAIKEGYLQLAAIWFVSHLEAGMVKFCTIS